MPWATADHLIVATDYENYTITYFCYESWWWGAEENLFIYTRDKSFSVNDLDQWSQIIEEKVPTYAPLDQYIVDVIQGDECPYESRPENVPTFWEKYADVIANWASGSD